MTNNNFYDSCFGSDMNKWTSNDSELRFLVLYFTEEKMLKWLTAEPASGYTPIKLWRFQKVSWGKQRIFLDSNFHFQHFFISLKS